MEIKEQINKTKLMAVQAVQAIKTSDNPDKIYVLNELCNYIDVLINLESRYSNKRIRDEEVVEEVERITKKVRTDYSDKRNREEVIGDERIGKRVRPSY
jgi:hypothetical protein